MNSGFDCCRRALSVVPDLGRKNVEEGTEFDLERLLLCGATLTSEGFHESDEHDLRDLKVGRFQRLIFEGSSNLCSTEIDSGGAAFDEVRNRRPLPFFFIFHFLAVEILSIIFEKIRKLFSIRDLNGGRWRIRTADLLHVKQAL